MKMIYLVIVSIVLAILTIGAASATADDNATAAVDDSGDVVSAPDGDLEIMGDEDDREDDWEEDPYDPKDPYSEDFNPIDIPENVPYKSDKNITFSVKEDIQGVIQVSDGREYDFDSGEYIYDYKDFTLTNGTAFIPLKDCEIKEHYFYFNFIAKGNTSQETASKINEYFEDSSFPVYVLPFVLPEYAYIGADVIIKLSTPDGVTGNVSAYYYEEKYDEEYGYYYGKGALISNASISDGQINIGRWDIGPQDVYFAFKNETDELYTDVLSQSFRFSVIDQSPDWQMELGPHDELLKTDMALFKIMSIPSELEGKFELYIDGNPIKCNVDYDNYYIAFNATGLSYGPHAFELKFLGDDYFNPVNVSGTFNLTDVVIEIPDKYDMGRDDSSIVITLPEDATGWIKITADGVVIYNEEIEVWDWDDEYNMGNVKMAAGLEKLKYGINNIVVNVTGKYSAVKKGQINATYSLQIGQDYLAYGDDTIELDIPNDASADVFVVIDGVEYKAIRDDGSYIKVPGNLSVGNHTVTLRYSGDERFPAKQFTDNLTVVPEIKLPFLDYGFDKNTEVISLKMPKDATGYLSIWLAGYVKGKCVYTDEKNITIVDGEATFSLANLSYGNYRLLIKYVDGNYPVMGISDEMEYFTINPELKYPSVMVEGENEFIILDLPGEYGSVSCMVFIDDYEITRHTNLVNGKASISLADFPAGDHEIEVIFTQEYGDGEDFYDDYYVQYVRILIQKPVIKASNANVVYSANSLYKIQITGVDKNMIAGKKVTFKINGKAIGTAKVDKKGFASVKITKTPGNYKITAVFNKVSVTKKLVVKHVLKLKKVTVKRSAKKLTIKAALEKVNGKYLKGKKITLKFNGKKLVAKTNKKGVAKFTIKSKVLKKLKKGKKVTYKAAYLKDTVKYTVKVK